VISTVATRTATHRAATLLVRTQYVEQSNSTVTRSPTSSLSARINHHTPETAPHATDPAQHSAALIHSRCAAPPRTQSEHAGVRAAVAPCNELV
jgi:hypothetical protein